MTADEKDAELIHAGVALLENAFESSRELSKQCSNERHFVMNVTNIFVSLVHSVVIITDNESELDNKEKIKDNVNELVSIYREHLEGMLESCMQKIKEVKNGKH